jgi:hypothetical protein
MEKITSDVISSDPMPMPNIQYSSMNKTGTIKKPHKRKKDSNSIEKIK